MTWPATWRPLAQARSAWWRQRQKDQRSELSVLYLFCGLTTWKQASVLILLLIDA